MSKNKVEICIYDGSEYSYAELEPKEPSEEPFEPNDDKVYIVRRENMSLDIDCMDIDGSDLILGLAHGKTIDRYSDFTRDFKVRIRYYILGVQVTESEWFQSLSVQEKRKYIWNLK